MAHKIGKRTFIIDGKIGVSGFGAVGSKKEGEGPLGEYFDIINNDSRFGMKTWEEAESEMQKLASAAALEKSGLSPEEIDLVFAGDLLNQCTASSFASDGSDIPFVGIYGACSTFAEASALGAIFCDSCAKNCLAVTSSHFCSAERQYRFPLEYGGQRPPSAQWTATASGAAVISRGAFSPFIKAVSFGSIADFGINDQNNMGGAMAPAAAETLSRFLRDTYTDTDDYDLIVTGDLGFVGADLFLRLMEEKGFSFKGNYNDCGLMLYEREKQQVEAGASGCGCSAAVISGYILPEMKKGTFRNVLALSTGALLSPTTALQGRTIPSVAHLVCYSTEKGSIF